MLTQSTLKYYDLLEESSVVLFDKEEWNAVVFPDSDEPFIINKWMKCFKDTVGCNHLFFSYLL